MTACDASAVARSDGLIREVPLTTFDVVKSKVGVQQHVEDQLAEETPVALIYNGISHAVMLATPQDLEDFALGFSLSEGILQAKHELYGIDVRSQASGIELHCEIASERFVKLKNRRRTLAGRTGCGLCGAESLEQAIRYPARLEVQTVFSSKAIQQGLQAMPQLQVLQQSTGATHACAWVSADGVVMLMREDVGRHNALDKLIGAIASCDSRQQGFIITSSRASYEMVQKTASAGVNLLVAISAPTGLAVRVAEVCGLTLVGFARKENYVIYSHPEYVDSTTQNI